MKYLVILTDGMSDEPQAQLNGLTPLQAAKTPHLDRLAQTAFILSLIHIFPPSQLINMMRTEGDNIRTDTKQSDTILYVVI